MATPIILDCDPGIDDALAIVFAHGHPGIDLLGLTTVAGNAGLAKTTVNALAVCEYIGAAGIPVTAGCAGPLLRPAFDARHVHGESGLGGAVLPPPVATAAPGHAVDYIIDTVGAARGEITLVATGPLTNIALAVKREPRLADWVREFVIMGGSAGRGNVTPAAEYNMWADPEAAAAVFRAGWTVTELGLDVTMRTGAAAAVMERMRALGPLGAELLLPALARYAVDRPGGAGRRAARATRARRVRGGLGGRARPVRAGPGVGPGGDGRAADVGDDRDRLRDARGGSPGQLGRRRQRPGRDVHRRGPVLGPDPGHLPAGRPGHGTLTGPVPHRAPDGSCSRSSSSDRRTVCSAASTRSA